MLDDAVDGAEDVVGALEAAIVDAPAVDDAGPAVAATEPARSQGFGGETMDVVVVVVCADARGLRWWGRRKQVIPGFARPGSSAPAHVTALLFVTVTSCHFFFFFCLCILFAQQVTIQYQDALAHRRAPLL